MRGETDVLNYVHSILLVQQKMLLENFTEPAGENSGTTAGVLYSRYLKRTE